MITPVPDITDPTLCLLPPVRTVKNKCRYITIERKYGKDLRCKPSDASEIARVRHHLFPTAVVRRKEQDVYPFASHPFPNFRVTPIPL